MILDDESLMFVPLVNDDGQYSLWPAAKPTPSGWRVAAAPSPRALCLQFIENTWTDMRPLSLLTPAAL